MTATPWPEVLEETEALTGREIERAYVDKGYARPRCAEAAPGLPVRAKARRSRPDQKGTEAAKQPSRR